MIFSNKENKLDKEKKLVNNKKDKLNYRRNDIKVKQSLIEIKQDLLNCDNEILELENKNLEYEKDKLNIELRKIELKKNCKTKKKNLHSKDHVFIKYLNYLEIILRSLSFLLTSIFIFVLIIGLYYLTEKVVKNVYVDVVLYIAWFFATFIINSKLLIKLSTNNILTKSEADFYKMLISVIFLFLLTLSSFFQLNPKYEDFKVVTFLLTISFSNLTPLATYIFRNHK